MRGNADRGHNHWLGTGRSRQGTGAGILCRSVVEDHGSRDVMLASRAVAWEAPTTDTTEFVMRLGGLTVCRG